MEVEGELQGEREEEKYRTGLECRIRMLHDLHNYTILH